MDSVAALQLRRIRPAVSRDKPKRHPETSQLKAMSVCWLVGFLTSQQMLLYLRDGSAQTIVRAATDQNVLPYPVTVY